MSLELDELSSQHTMSDRPLDSHVKSDRLPYQPSPAEHSQLLRPGQQVVSS
ncbi:MAG TPA: hypothetical protein V6D20_21800 [Candidatus Obscuribacterales bacterium]